MKRFLASLLTLLVWNAAATAQQVQPAAQAADVTPASSDLTMQPAYAKSLARMAYIWGWPLMNQHNRRIAITQAPRPGRLNGVLPAAPRGQIAMLNDYIDPGQTFVTCPNQDITYGLGFFALDEEPAPDGHFSLYIRAYWGKQAILDGSWKPPVIKKTG